MINIPHVAFAQHFLYSLSGHKQFRTSLLLTDCCIRRILCQHCIFWYSKVQRKPFKGHYFLQHCQNASFQPSSIKALLNNFFSYTVQLSWFLHKIIPYCSVQNIVPKDIHTFKGNVFPKSLKILSESDIHITVYQFIQNVLKKNSTLKRLLQNPSSNIVFLHSLETIIRKGYLEYN